MDMKEKLRQLVFGKKHVRKELIKIAKAQGVDITKDQAEAYVSEMDELDLTSAQLAQVAGGGFWDEPLNAPCRGQQMFRKMQDTLSSCFLI